MVKKPEKEGLCRTDEAGSERGFMKKKGKVHTPFAVGRLQTRIKGGGERNNKEALPCPGPGKGLTGT